MVINRNRVVLLLGLIFVLLGVGSCTEEKETEELLFVDARPANLIPEPLSIQYKEGTARLSLASVQSLINNTDFVDEALYFQGLFGANQPSKDIGSTAEIIFDPCDSCQGEEAYELYISPEKIVLKANSAAGCMRGIQTLRQLRPPEFHQPNNNQHAWGLPCLEIKDAPRFPWRGMLLDCSRHFMTVDFVKRYIDLLAFYKMNTLHWHITEDQGWRLAVDAFPKLTEVGAWRDDSTGGQYGGFYSKEQVKEIVAYASERHIQVVPEIELPGHAQAALAAYPQFSCTGGPFKVQTEWGVFKEIYCAGNDSTFLFLEAVLDEVIELFPGEYIHIGGDEVPKFRWENCNKCQNRMKTEGIHDEHELQSYFIQRIERYINSKGKKMIGWDEILEGGLSANATVQSWRGFEGATTAARMHHQVIVSPTSHAYFDYGLESIDLETVYAFEPIPEDLEPEFHSHVLGGECNLWSERAPQNTVDSKVFPRILAMSEVLWSPKADRDFTEFSERVQANYPVLEALGVDYGFERPPVRVEYSTNAEGDLQVQFETGQANLTVYSTLDTSDQSSMVEGAKKHIFKNKNEDALVWAKSCFDQTNCSDWKPYYQRMHQGFGKSISLANPYNKWYTAGGDSALLNGLAGSNNFRDGQWQGYSGVDLEAIVDLGSSMDVSSLNTQCFQYNNAWIFLPHSIEVWLSDGGVNFTSVGRLDELADPKKDGQFAQEFSIEWEMKKARYVKVHVSNFGVCPEWHDAAGSEAWLFIDELVIR